MRQSALRASLRPAMVKLQLKLLMMIGVLVVGPLVDVVARLAEGRVELLEVGQGSRLCWDW